MEKSQSMKGYIFAFLTMVIWSGWMIISRMGLKSELTPFDVTFLRFTSAGLIMLPIALKNLHLITRKNWLGLLLMVVGAGAPYLIVTSYGFKNAPASHGLLTPCSMTLIVAILSYFILNERITKVKFVGYILILCGIVFKFSADYSGSIDTADLYFLAGGILWSIYTVQNKRLRFLSAIVATSFVASFSMILLIIPYAIYQLNNPHPLPIIPAISQIIYQGIFTSIISLIMYNRALLIIGAAQSSSFAAINPVLVMALAIPFLGEYPNHNDIIFAGLMSSGVFLASGIIKLRKAHAPLTA